DVRAARRSSHGLDLPGRGRRGPGVRLADRTGDHGALDSVAARDHQSHSAGRHADRVRARTPSRGGMAAVSARGTPEVPLLVVTLAAMLLIVTGTFDQLFAITAFLVTGIYASSVLALIRLRGREPFASRPFRAWGYPWTARVVLCGSVAFLGGAIVSDSANRLAALAFPAL